MTAGWSTLEEISAHRDTIAASIDGWSEPVVFAVGLSSATSSAEYEYPVIGVGEDYHSLPAVILAKTVGYSAGTSTHALSVAELTHALNGLAPSQSCAAYDQSTLRAWREMLAEVESNPYRSIVAVFVGDLDDPVSSEADGSLRTQLPA